MEDLNKQQVTVRVNCFRELQKMNCWSYLAKEWYSKFVDAVISHNYLVRESYYQQLIGYIWALNCNGLIDNDMRREVIYYLIYVEDFVK